MIQFGEETGPATRCILCNKKLVDEESIARGIGSECYQGVIKLAETLAEKGYKASSNNIVINPTENQCPRIFNLDKKLF